MAERAGPPIVEVTRHYRFSAAHRMHNPRFSANENARTYGRCNHPQGHGHTYRIAVTLRGPVSDATEGLAALPALDAAVGGRLLARLDQTNLDEAITPEDGPTSTTEALLRLCWRLLEPALPAGSLWRLRIEETPNNYFETDRDEMQRAPRKAGATRGAEA